MLRQRIWWRGRSPGIAIDFLVSWVLLPMLLVAGPLGTILALEKP
jgi:hypothetical protein